MAVVWWEIETPSPDAFQSFHAALSGWSFREAFVGGDLGADYWIVCDGGTDIGGLQRGEAGLVPQPGVRLYLEVDDLEPTLERALALGAVVERERTALGGDDRWFAVVTDPTGVSFGLWTARAAASDNGYA